MNGPHLTLLAVQLAMRPNKAQRRSLGAAVLFLSTRGDVSPAAAAAAAAASPRLSRHRSAACSSVSARREWSCILVLTTNDMTLIHADEVLLHYDESNARSSTPGKIHLCLSDSACIMVHVLIFQLFV